MVDRSPDDEKTAHRTAVTPSDVDNLPKIKEMIEEEIEWMQPLFDYALEHYDDEFRKHAGDCPDPMDFDDDLRYRQARLWFITEFILPSTGRTVLEEFVENFVSPNQPDVARRILLYGRVIRGSFRVLDMDHLPLILVERKDSGERYVAVTKIVDEDSLRRTFFPGSTVRGKIHPWWNGYFMFDGILSREMTDEERIAQRLRYIIDPEYLMERYNRAQTSRYESIRVNYGTTLRSSMNRYPSQWVDGMCIALDIDTKVIRRRADKIAEVLFKLVNGYAKTLLEGKLSRQVAALQVLYENDWIVRYGQLTRRFSWEMDYWWNEHPPTSDIGLLRLHGFIVVGKLPSQGRMYTVAVVPAEMRPFVLDAILSRK